MSADIFKRKMALVIQLKWIFLALKWAVCLFISLLLYVALARTNTTKGIQSLKIQ